MQGQNTSFSYADRVSAYCNSIGYWWCQRWLLSILSRLSRPAYCGQSITPYEYLERGMAQSSAAALRLANWSASAEASFVVFPSGAVNVDWGCNGFDMALTMLVAGLVMGLFLQQSRLRIVALMALGVTAALLFNIPRVMLLAVASVYWGPDTFSFWHGPWGGQIFSGILFTAYYYSVQWVVNAFPRNDSRC